MDQEAHQAELIDRPIKELLQIMLNHQDLFYGGLCTWNNDLFRKKLILSSERDALYKYIYNNRPCAYSSFNAFKYRYHIFYWEPKKISYRIKWLKKHIKANS